MIRTKISSFFTFNTESEFIKAESPHFPEIEIMIIFPVIKFMFNSACNLFLCNVNNPILINKMTFRNIFSPERIETLRMILFVKMECVIFPVFKISRTVHSIDFWLMAGNDPLHMGIGCRRISEYQF